MKNNYIIVVFELLITHSEYSYLDGISRCNTESGSFVIDVIKSSSNSESDS